MKWILRLLIVALWLASLFYMFGIGAGVAIYRPDKVDLPVRQAIRLMDALPLDMKLCPDDQIEGCGFNDVTAKTQVSCAPFQQADSRTAVLFTFGQSNSANNVSDRYFASEAVANFNPFDGQCYRAEDPLLGATMEDGSVWGRMADGLIAQGAYDRVLIVAIGVGGSWIDRWTVGGDLHPRLLYGLDRLAAQGITPTHMLWHQGEADKRRGTSQQAYVDAFTHMTEAIRAHGVTAPLYPAQATWCNMFDSADAADERAAAAPVRAAQAQLPDVIEGVFAGPDTDTLTGKLYRYDNCHFNGYGARAHAQLWVQALTEIARD